MRYPTVKRFAVIAIVTTVSVCAIALVHYNFETISDAFRKLKNRHITRLDQAVDTASEHTRGIFNDKLNATGRLLFMTLDTANIRREVSALDSARRRDVQEVLNTTYLTNFPSILTSLTNYGVVYEQRVNSVWYEYKDAIEAFEKALDDYFHRKDLPHTCVRPRLEQWENIVRQVEDASKKGWAEMERTNQGARRLSRSPEERQRESERVRKWRERRREGSATNLPTK